MIKLLRNKFSSLIIPDANSLNPSVSRLVNAASQFKDGVSILALGTSRKSLEEFYQTHKFGSTVFIAEH